MTTWLTIDQCKLVGILGIGGIGKTALAARSIDSLTGNFDLIIRLVSCSLDGSIKVWGLADSRLSEQPYAIESDTPYQNLRLSGVQGLNRSQLDTLIRLGGTK